MSSKTIFRQSTDIISIPSGDYTVEELEAYIRLGKLVFKPLVSKSSKTLFGLSKLAIMEDD